MYFQLDLKYFVPEIFDLNIFLTKSSKLITEKNGGKYLKISSHAVFMSYFEGKHIYPNRKPAGLESVNSRGISHIHTNFSVQSISSKSHL